MFIIQIVHVFDNLILYTVYDYLLINPWRPQILIWRKKKKSGIFNEFENYDGVFNNFGKNDGIFNNFGEIDGFFKDNVFTMACFLRRFMRQTHNSTRLPNFWKILENKRIVELAIKRLILGFLGKNYSYTESRGLFIGIKG